MHIPKVNKDYVNSIPRTHVSRSILKLLNTPTYNFIRSTAGLSRAVTTPHPKHNDVSLPCALEAVQVMLSIKHNTRTDSSDKQSLKKFWAGPAEYAEWIWEVFIVCEYRSVRCIANTKRFVNNNNGTFIKTTQATLVVASRAQTAARVARTPPSVWRLSGPAHRAGRRACPGPRAPSPMPCARLYIHRIKQQNITLSL